jgi:hypothetical protein
MIFFNLVLILHDFQFSIFYGTFLTEFLSNSFQIILILNLIPKLKFVQLFKIHSLLLVLMHLWNYSQLVLCEWNSISFPKEIYLKRHFFAYGKITIDH